MPPCPGTSYGTLTFEESISSNAAEAGWDTFISQLDVTQEDLQYWLENLDTCNGKTWLKKAIQRMCVGMPLKLDMLHSLHMGRLHATWQCILLNNLTISVV